MKTETNNKEIDMSWGIEITGTKEAVKAKVAESLDKIGTQYGGKQEAVDVYACRERILALIDATALGADGYGTIWNAISVKASGSHGITNTPVDGITSASFSVQVTRVSLAI